MIYTKEKFKELWESAYNGGGITLNDILDCAKALHLFTKPRIYPIHKVGNAVLKAANCKEYFEE